MLPRNVKLLGWASFLNDVASEMVYPLMPKFLIDVLGGNKAQLGLIEGLADSVASLLKLFAGGWSDRLGVRRAFVVVGYGLTTFSRPIIGLATVPWHLVSLRAADRVGKGIRTAPRDAMIADAATPQQRGPAFAFHRGMDHLGAAVGPLLALALLWFWPGNLRLLFVVTAVPGVLVLLLLVYGLREPARQDVTATKPGFQWSLRPFDARFRRFLLAMVIFTLGNSSDAFLLVRAGELGAPDWSLPLLWCLFHVAKSFGTMWAGRWINPIGPRPMIVAGWLIYAAVYVAFGLASEVWQIWALFFGYAVFYSLTEPAEKTLVASLVRPEDKGLAFGWYNFAIGVAAFPASVLFGAIYETAGPLTAFGCGAGLAFVAAILLMQLDAKHR